MRPKPHFKKGDNVLAKWMGRCYRGKVLFIFSKTKTAAVVIEKGQHPIFYGTNRFDWKEIYKPS